MGRGDKRTRRGKIYTGSYGNSRPHTKKAAAKKAAGGTAARAGKRS
ncbi:MAG: 30S ribosomal protein THX [Xanthomonadales bacterium]|nr:30S ribosomal protein THX [Xanthomonadales bacterium]